MIFIHTMKYFECRCIENSIIAYYFLLACIFLAVINWRLIVHYLWVKVASWRRENATRPIHIHMWCALREFVGLGWHQQLLAYLHTISDCFPVAFLPDVLLAYADLSSFSPSPFCFSSLFFHWVTRDEFSYFSPSSSDAFA